MISQANKLLMSAIIFCSAFVFDAKVVQAATDAVLSFDQLTVSADVEQTVTLVARIDPGTNEVGGVELDVSFDPAVLRLDSVTKSDNFNITLSSAVINNTDGKASIDLGLMTDPPTYITSTSDVATFIFTALSPAENSQISFSSTSNASAHGEYVVAARTVSQVSIGSIEEENDTIAPLVTNFEIAPSSSSLEVSVINFTATDIVGVVGYKLTENATIPLASDYGWRATAPASYTFSSAGTKTLYAWAKDAAGNVSSSLSDSVTIELIDIDNIIPRVISFSIPSTSSSLTVPITNFTAEDDVEVIGYKLTEESVVPLANDNGWNENAPTSYTFSLAGLKTLYAWVKDAAGNISESLSDSVEIILQNDTDEDNGDEEDDILLSDGEPVGELPSNTIAVNLSLKTNKNATCRFSEDDNISYDNMAIDFTATGETNHSYRVEGLKEGGEYEYYVKCKDDNGKTTKDDYLISFSIKDKESKKDKEEEKTKRKITNSQSSIKMGQILIQKGKRFSKNAEVLLYFSKPDGSYYPPVKVKTNSEGKFEVTYKVNKPKGKYTWYAVDTKTGRKSKIKDYIVK